MPDIRTEQGASPALLSAPQSVMENCPAEQHKPSAAELSDFLCDFLSALLCFGSQTVRVDRNAARIAAAYGYAVDLAIFPNHLMLTLSSKDGQERCTSVGSIQAGGPDFSKVSGLNALSWSIVDQHLSLTEARRRFNDILAGPTYKPAVVRFMVACANASFCRLFDGDPVSMGFVFVATLLAFHLRQLLTRLHVDGRIVFVCCAFLASLVAAPDVLMHLGTTPQTGLAASVLFLIPGLPLINSILDILDGHVLMGLSRIVRASILIACIALGLAMTMALLGEDSL